MRGGMAATRWASTRDAAPTWGDPRSVMIRRSTFVDHGRAGSGPDVGRCFVPRRGNPASLGDRLRRCEIALTGGRRQVHDLRDT